MKCETFGADAEEMLTAFPEQFDGFNDHGSVQALQPENWFSSGLFQGEALSVEGRRASGQGRFGREGGRHCGEGARAGGGRKKTAASEFHKQVLAIVCPACREIN